LYLELYGKPEERIQATAYMIANMTAHSVTGYKFIFWSLLLYILIGLHSENGQNAVAPNHHTSTSHVPEFLQTLKRHKITKD